MKPIFFSVIIVLFLGLLSMWGCRQKKTKLFQQVNEDISGVKFINKLVESESQNITEYLYFYNGAGVAIGDINNDNLPDLFFTSNQGENKLYLNNGSFNFKDITESANVAGMKDWSTGVTMADINGDGFLDIYVCQVGNYKWLQGRNLLYINNGDLTFSEEAEKYGLAIKALSTQAAFFDYDKDGDLDMYLLCHSVHSSDTYTKATTRMKYNELSADRFFKNIDGRFVDNSKQAGIWQSALGYGLGITVGDLNNDTWPDIYISNDFHENDYLYYNNQGSGFTEGLIQSMGHTSYYSMGNDLADFNNDGNIDVVSLDMKPEDFPTYKKSVGPDSYEIFEFKRSFGYHYQYPRNVLQLNMGIADSITNVFSEIGQLAGIDATDWSWSALLADFNLDGWKDLYVTNGIVRRPNDLDYLKYFSNPLVQKNVSNIDLISKMPEGQSRNYSFENKKNINFENKSADWGLDQSGVSNGAAYADLDLDGDLDLVVNNINEKAYLLKNNAVQALRRHYLKIKLKGTGMNKFGLGARVSIYMNGALQIQELYPVRGFQSSSAYTLVFGLDTITVVDSIQVHWPSGGASYLYSIPGDTTLLIDERDKSLETKSHFDTTSGQFLTDITATTSINFKHRENRLNDMNTDKLSPHLLSTEGPKIAIGDVNGDGNEDFFICGAKDQAAALYIQQPIGSFNTSNEDLWESEKSFENVDATFFDADNDGDLDLYIVNAGNEFAGNSPYLLDYIYINNGNGEFSKTEDNLPKFHENGSCVRPCDFDLDGDIDLFVGTLNNYGKYGIGPKNYLLENDGNGNFTNYDHFNSFSMVKDATWTDVDSDGDPDLVVVGPWFPIQIYLNEKSRFSKKDLALSSGMWNCIEANDIDMDGDIDFILGNMGLNTSLAANITDPMRLYVSDFDNNHSFDPVLTLSQPTGEYPLYHFDEIASQLVFIKKQFPYYRDFANATLKDILSNQQINNATVGEVYNLSSILLRNEGNCEFQMISLPIEAQFSSVNSILILDINEDNKNDLLLGGNFYHNHPAIGRQDASFGWIMLGNGMGGFTPMYPDKYGFHLNGQLRDMKIIKLPNNQRGIILGKNNDWLKILGINR